MNYARQYPRFWLAYFVYSVLMFAASVVHDIHAFGSDGPPVPWASVLAGVGLRPLHGYVRQRRHDPRWLWTVLLAVSGAAKAALMLICGYFVVCTMSGRALLLMAVALVSGGPYVLALQQYVYQSPQLWKPDRPPPAHPG
jgi:hypothetical protein